MKVPDMNSADRLSSSAGMNLIGRDATANDIDRRNDCCDRSIPNSTAVDRPWYVAHTKVQQEQVACENLVRQSYAVYLPRIKVLKRSRRHRCQEMQLEPLFPRYLFFQPRSNEHSIAPVRSTLGVTTIVRFGHTLAVLRHEVLESIRDFETRQNEAGLEEISPFRNGESVLVVDGPLAGMEGLVSSISQERVVVLMHLLGHDARVTLSHHQLQVVN